MTAKRLPARLHVLLARDAPRGVVIRRGPSKLVCTVGWNRRTDEFIIGQWLRGRIYESLCDLSPDGKHLLYFAAKFDRPASEPRAWTAISRAPYLKAIAFYPTNECYGGGGMFTGNDTYCLRGSGGEERLQRNTGLRRDMHFRPPAEFDWGGPGFYCPLLLRNGWILVDWARKYTIFEKPIRRDWVLRRICHNSHRKGKAWAWHEHEVVNEATGNAFRFPEWEWADVDRKRLVWTSAGCLYAGTLKSGTIADQRILHDFNEMTFEPMAAPYD